MKQPSPEPLCPSTDLDPPAAKGANLLGLPAWSFVSPARRRNEPHESPRGNNPVRLGFRCWQPHCREFLPGTSSCTPVPTERQ